MELNKLSSAILNDLWGGNLIPLNNRSLISLEQIEDEIIEERAAVIKEWYLRNLLNKHDLMLAINCVEVDCKDQNKCPCLELTPSNEAKHFEIPILMDGLGEDAIEFIGSIDRGESYEIFFNKEAASFFKYKRRGSWKPFVYIEKTPNANNMYDGWIFNAPYVKHIAVIGIFKDPRQLEDYNCCEEIEYLDLGSISNEIKKRILAKKANLYRAAVPAVSQTT